MNPGTLAGILRRPINLKTLWVLHGCSIFDPIMSIISDVFCLECDDDDASFTFDLDEFYNYSTRILTLKIDYVLVDFFTRASS